MRKYAITEIVDAILVVSLSWLVIPALSALIYSYTIGLDYIDSFFESLSGFSGTGLTVLAKPEDLPYVVLIWRASTQWMGELGIIVFSAALLPYIHRVLSRVYVAERGVKLAPTILSTARRLLIMYTFLTLVGTVVLMLSGMNFLDALAHSMTGIATGGMSTNSQSIGYWYKTAGYLVLITSTIVMVFGALNFADLYELLRGRIRRFVGRLEVKWFLYLLAILTIISTITVISTHGLNLEMLSLAIYNMVSGYTTTGFQVGDIGREYPDTLKLVIVLAMAVGGATFSTAGGIKIKRIAIALKSIGWTFAKPFLPEKAYLVRRVGDEVLSEDDVISVYAYIMLYAIVALIISYTLYIVLNFSGYTWSKNYIDALFETVSALSCVGLSTGITSISMPVYAKVVLMLAMYLGRLEFAPIYIVIGYQYKSRVTL